MWNPFRLLVPKRYVGIDIGTAFVKITEVSRFGHRKKLESYGSISASVLYQKPFRTFDKNTLILSSDDVSRAIKAVLDEAGIKTKQAIFSIPDFSTFFTTFELPPMSPEEIPQAVKYEARQHIPLPLGEVTLDWQIIQEKSVPGSDEKIKILLVAVPNEVISQYQRIAELCQLDLVALEAEVFSLIRSSVQEEERGVVAVIDIGAQSTTCSIVEKKLIRASHSFDMSGNELTMTLSNSLSLDFDEAEKIKEKYGILGQTGPDDRQGGVIKEILSPLLDAILREVGTTINIFSQKEGKEVAKVILAGGTAFLPGLKEYFQEQLKKDTEICNPFSSMFYTPILEKKLEEMGPSFAIAVGASLRGLEY